MASLKGKRIHLVGIKGTGLCALAELCQAHGATLSGSDVSETFYTDAILARLSIPVKVFSASNIVDGIELVVHSAAYKPDSHEELLAAAERGILVINYPTALGLISGLQVSCAIAGVHGKTTTTALAGSLVQATGLAATVLAGSAVSSFGDRSTLVQGSDYFIAETCEYRRHFLHFRPAIILVTSIEPDHQDYYPDYQAMLAAFVEFCLLLPQGGRLVYCADDPGAAELATIMAAQRSDLIQIPYGFEASGPFRITSLRLNAAGLRLSSNDFCLQASGSQAYSLHLPGRHLVLDAAGAIALHCTLIHDLAGRVLDNGLFAALAAGIAAFKGSRRRVELIGEANGIVYMDDYAHHPTAVRLTLQGLRQFHPGRRLVVDFMSHTYSRTTSLFTEFSQAFADADYLVLHDIYPSARENAPDSYPVNGFMLFEAIQKRGVSAVFFSQPLEAVEHLRGVLQSGDLFISMGAGDNWQLSHELYRLGVEGSGA